MKQEIIVKSILNKSRLPESDYCLNPYIGCTHNCKYCYARFMRRFTGHKEAWGSFVDIKINAPEVLRTALEKKKFQGTVLVGSVCDAYQPVESAYQITRQCIELLVKHNVSFSILTKSKLVLRDLDLFKKAGDRVSVGISLSILNDVYRKQFEPGASSVEDRLNALKILSKNNIKTYLFVGPVLPLVSDIKAILERAKDLTNEFWAERLNLKCGNLFQLQAAYSAIGISPDWLTIASSACFWQEQENIISNFCKSNSKKLQGIYQH